MSALEENNLNERVHVDISMTKNLGDFNSLKLTVGLTRDLKPGEKLGEAYASIRAGLEKELDKGFTEALGE